MSFCRFTLGADYDCSAPLQPGLLNYLILINLDDIASYTIVDDVVSAITLKTGKQAYKFETVKQSIQAEYEKAGGLTSNYYIHRIKFNVFDISSEQKENLEKLALNKIVAITSLINSPGNDNTYFEVYGAHDGLECVEMQRINNDIESNGSFIITLESSGN